MGRATSRGLQHKRKGSWSVFTNLRCLLSELSSGLGNGGLVLTNKASSTQQGRDHHTGLEG